MYYFNNMGYCTARLKELLRFWKKLYINAFRVEMKNGERVSRTISKTNSNLHHLPEAFISIRFS